MDFLEPMQPRPAEGPRRPRVEASLFLLLRVLVPAVLAAALGGLHAATAGLAVSLLSLAVSILITALLLVAAITLVVSHVTTSYAMGGPSNAAPGCNSCASNFSARAGKGRGPRAELAERSAASRRSARPSKLRPTRPSCG